MTLRVQQGGSVALAVAVDVAVAGALGVLVAVTLAVAIVGALDAGVRTTDLRGLPAAPNAGAA